MRAILREPFVHPLFLIIITLLQFLLFIYLFIVIILDFYVSFNF